MAVWAIQFYLKGQAEGFIQSKLVGSSLAVDEEDQELLTSYKEVVNCLLDKYATDEVIAEAYTDVTNIRQGSAVDDSAFGQSLWDKTARCGTVFSDRRRKQLFAEGLMDSIRSQVVHHLSNHPSMTFQSLVKFAQGLGKTYRAARRNTSRVEFEDRTGRTKRPVPRSVLSIETSSAGASSDWEGADQDGVLAIGGQDSGSLASRGTASPSTTQTSSTRSPAYPPSRQSSEMVTPHSRGAFIRTNPKPMLATSILRPGTPPNRPPSAPARDQQWTNCRLSFGPHPSEDCPEVPAQLRDQLLAAREQNYVTRRTEGTLPSQLRQRYAYNPRQSSNGQNHSDPVSTVNDVEADLDLAELSNYGTPAETPTHFPHGPEEKSQDRA